MADMFSAAQDRARTALALCEKASASWEVLHTSANTAEILAAGGRYVCTMRRDAPDDLAFVLEARKLLPLLADDCQTLAAELGRLVETRNQQAAECRTAEEAHRAAAEALEAERASLAAEREELLARTKNAEAERDALRAEADASGPWEQNPVVWERFRIAAQDWDPRASCAGCGAVTWLAFRATYCKCCRRPPGSPGLDWLADRRPYPPEPAPSPQTSTTSTSDEKASGFVDAQGIPRVSKLRDPT